MFGAPRVDGPGVQSSSATGCISKVAGLSEHVCGIVRHLA